MCVTIQIKATEQYFAVRYCRTVTGRQGQLTDVTLRTTVSIANGPYSEHGARISLFHQGIVCHVSYDPRPRQDWDHDNLYYKE